MSYFPMMNAATTAGGAVRTRPRSLGYRPALDGIRAIAILAVFAFHGSTPLVGGFIGVDIFFVLSGFLITTLLLQEWSRTHTIRLGDFYLRRARRLLPALFVTIAGVGVIYAFDPDLRGGVGFASAAAAVVFYVGNWITVFVDRPGLGLLDHTWSLAIEEQFYILWPPLLLVCLRRNWQPRRLLVLTLILGCASAALRGVLWTQHIGGNVYFRSDARADALLLGCALAAVYSTEQGRRLLQRCAASWIPPVVAAAVLLGFGLRVGVTDRFVFVGGLSLVAVCSAVLIAHVVIAERSWVTRTLGFSTLAWIGARSYGMYLFHIPIFEVCGRILSGQPGRVVFPTQVALTMLAAAASYRWIESYFLLRSRHPAGAPPHVQRYARERPAEGRQQHDPAQSLSLGSD
jgi:peptidoglycan/LPS O-acetylase OafA/YrhL